MHRRGTGTGGLYDILAVPRYPPGHDFVHEMQRAASHCARIIVVLSPAYARSEFGEAEWRVAFTRDPSGEKGLLIPIRVAAGLLFSRVYVDLAGCGDEETARALLLEGVRSTITRPITATLPGMIIGSRPAADGRERRAKVQCPAGSPTLYHPPVVRVRPLNLPDRAAQRLLRPGRARGRRPTTANCVVRSDSRGPRLQEPPSCLSQPTFWTIGPAPSGSPVGSLAGLPPGITAACVVLRLLVPVALIVLAARGATPHNAWPSSATTSGASALGLRLDGPPTRRVRSPGCQPAFCRRSAVSAPRARGARRPPAGRPVALV